jgi:NAD(P)-dependent dehydrogenase (short-subunit alcohol dehydrogenase family)
MTQVSLAGRRFLITGATRGIGRACAVELTRRGARVVALGRDRGALDATLALLSGDGHDGVLHDVAEAAGWDEVFATVDAGGPLDGLVTAAAVIEPVGRLGTVSPEAFARCLAVNVMGTYLALHHALPRMDGHDGRVVTFSGGGATAPLPRFDAYATSKAAVVRLTENIAAAAPGGVELNAVAPGFVVTQMHEHTLQAGPDATGADYFEKTRKVVEEGGGVPPELAAELVAFLLSPEAAGITGKLLSAQWDPWREPDFQARLRAEPNLATLRRIDEQFFSERSR